MNSRQGRAPSNVVDAPLPDGAPWDTLPFPTYWVNHFPANQQMKPEFLAAIYNIERQAQWVEQFEDQDTAFSGALHALRSEHQQRAVVYRYKISSGSINLNSPSEYAILIDGYYEISLHGIATWVSATEIPELTTQDSLE